VASANSSRKGAWRSLNRVAPKGTGSSAIRTDEASRSSLASRAGELHREVGSVLLATFAEVPRGTADLGSIDVTDVCDPYTRTTPESTGPFASPQDDFRKRRARREGARPRLVKVVRSGSEGHHDCIAGDPAALVLASRRAFGKHAARIRLSAAGEAGLSRHRLRPGRFRPTGKTFDGSLGRLLALAERQRLAPLGGRRRQS
jgi:hypothetical protein